MTKYLMKKFALSQKGAKDMIISILASVAMDLSLMFPVSLLYLFTQDLTGGVKLKQRIPFYAAGIIICCILILITCYWQYNASFKATYIESGVRRINLAEKLRKLPLSFFGKKDLADLTTAIMSDAEVLEKTGSHIIPHFYGSMISTVIISVGLFIFNWRMALAAVWPVPLAFIIVVSSKKVSNLFNKKHNDARVDLNEGIQEFIETSRDLKSNNAENEYLKGLDTKITKIEKKAIAAEFGTAVFVVSAQMLLKFGIGTVAILGGTLLVSGELSLMEFFCFLLVASRFYEPMSGTLVNLASINSIEVNVDRMNEITDTKEQTGSDNFKPENYNIVFENAGFSYEDGKSVLKEVSFTANQGEVTALVGPSGGGKTTVSRLASRFWDLDKGKITIGGIDISQVDPEVLLGSFSIVFQDVTLFNNSVKENIRVGKKDATDEEVMKAAKLAGCDDFIAALPQGYDTIIGENGSELSGGERQRISIARAFLKDAPIILLDEATASLDVENETKVQTALSRLIKNKTVLIIAHRMRTIAGVNKVVVLADGTVAEQGNPSELMAKKGLFAKMVELQTEGQNWQITAN